MNSADTALKLESGRLLGWLVDRSKRKSGIQLPIGFVRTDDPASPPPLARMLRGGRGGAVRIKLYLCITLLASHQPYDIRSTPARAWAETLALPDPQSRGARRVADAIKWLGDEQLISVEHRRGAAPTITLLDPASPGREYTRPVGQYISVPLEFWREQWITAMSGTAVALFIVLLDRQGGVKSPAHAPSLTTAQRQRYGLSQDTWTRATKELARHELLQVRRVPQGRDFEWRRVRNTYWIDKGRLSLPPASTPTRGVTPTFG